MPDAPFALPLVFPLNPPPSDSMRLFLEALGRVGRRLRDEALLPLRREEFHAAIYEPGGYYRRHLDTKRDSSERMVSCVYYLTRDRELGDGGELRLHLPTGPVDVVPQTNRLVLFQSATVPHEVLLNHKRRYSLSGWLNR
jgi:SM-20-related protein